MSSERIIMPLLYRDVVTLEYPIWYLDNRIFLVTIYDEDYGAFLKTEEDDFYKKNIDSKIWCIYVNEPSFEDFNVYIKEMAIKLKFVLNNFSSGIPVVLPFAALISTKDENTHIKKLSDIEAVANLHSFKKKILKIRPTYNSETVATHFKIVNQCCDKNRSLLFTLGRFNSCLSRHEILDKIVDITICLESIIGGTQELRYRFSLHHSLISESDVQSRMDAFDFFMALYDARSAIVHGDVSPKDAKKKIDKIENNWNKILRLAKSSINYYLFYLFQNSDCKWDQHLKNLVFGKDKRIVD